MSFSVPNYKILAFEPDRGIITINFEGSTPLAYRAPVVDGAYLSGENLDLWVKSMFSTLVYSSHGMAEPEYPTIANADAVTAMIDGTPFA